MALAGELAKYVGKELANTGSKALAKAGATSALSSLVPSAVTKVGADLANKSVLSSLVPATARKLASGLELGSEAVPLFRGQMNRLDRLDYNNPNGVSPNSNGFFMTPNKGATDSWAGKGIISVDADPNDIMTLSELEGLKKDAERYFSDPKYQMQIYNTNPRQAEIYDALEASDNYQSLSQLMNKPFIERDGGQGKELGELVFFPDTRPELTAKYNDILASGKNQWATPAVDNTPSPTSLPVGTQIKFNKDLSIKSVDKPSKGRGWFADNKSNPHISKMVKENGLDKYLGEPVDDSIKLYHGTPNKFEDFDENLPSVWFSDSDKNLRDTGLTIKGNSPMNVMERSMPKNLKIADEDLADRLTKQQLQDRGYAGVAYTERGPNGDETYYEIFKPNETLQKIPEVRQAIDDNLMKSKVELSPAQQEFFKNSKLKDANGQLIPVYHSTPNNFTVFDNSKLGENTMYSNTAMGHFVTTDKDFSSRFKDINGKGLDGTTMELYANVTKPITHPYLAGWKYSGDELDKIVEDYLIATDNQEFLDTLREYAADNNSSIYDEYMDMTFTGEDPFEFSGDERKLLEDKGYDAVEIIEGPKSGLVDGSKDDNIISSYAVFDGKNLKNVNNLKPTTNPDIRYSRGDSLTDIAKRLNAMKSSRNISEDAKRIGSSEVAPVREETLPAGWKELDKYLDTSKDRLSLAIGKPRSKITRQDLIDFLEENGYDTEGTKDELWKNALMCIDDMAVDDLYNAGGSAGQFLQERLPFRHSDSLTDATNYYLGAKGRTGRLDAEYSDRLGIGRSNTPMSDRLVNTRSGAVGDYAKGAFGTDPTWATGESGVSTAAHERMHAWQDINKFDWDEEVVDAIDELRGELKKFYHDKDAIQKYWGASKTDYYMEDIEQEARMLQSYLDNEGFTNTYRKTSEKGTEWGNEIKPAFDKFYKKLRSLSKAGVALPAIAALFGLSTNTGGKLDKKS